MTAKDAPHDIRQLLRTICVQLAAPVFGGERLSFRRYELVDWLMGRDLSGEAPGDRAGTVIRLLRGRHRRRRQDQDETPDISELDVGPRYQWLIWGIRRAMPEVFFRAAVSGRIPGFGRRYRWFMRQPYLSPLRSVNFPGFAERLTEGVRQSEDIDQADKLLVHAFLQDLRWAYSRRLGRLEGWRRTAYPVVLIDNAVEGSSDYRLMRLINDVRNETGQDGPLLVVCASDRVPQDPVSDTFVEIDSSKLSNRDPAYVDEDYRRWADKFPGSRRPRVDTAWYLPISVTGSNDLDPGPRKPTTAAPPPWFARRGVVGVVVVILALPVVVWIGWGHGGGLTCSHIPFLGQVEVHGSEDGQCIGYSDSNHFLFNDEPGQERLRDVQKKIFKQNVTVRDLWERSNRTRPYATIIYLAALTGRPTTRKEEAYAAEREELEGLAIAQYETIKKPGDSSEAPLLNIVVANGGFQLGYARRTVGMIVKLAARDATVVGVVGMGESRESTAVALKDLNNAGIPLIGPVTSADDFHQNSRLFLQLTAPNREYARMIAEYSKQVLKKSEARIYWTTGKNSNRKEDLYVDTLVEDLERILPETLEFPIKVAGSAEFKGPLNSGDVCGYQGMLIFAGRWTEFSDFLNALRVTCGSNPPLHVIADDSVERYMDNPALRGDAPDNIPVTYVSKTTLGSCWYLQAVDGAEDPVRGRFLRLIQDKELFESPRCGPGGEPVGSRDALGYDAATIIIRAVESLGQELRLNPRSEWDPRSILPVAVHVKIVEQIRRNPFEGVSGMIQFDGDSGEPTEKRISLLKVEKITDTKTRPVEVFHCGRAYLNNDPKNEDAKCRPFSPSDLTERPPK